MVSFVKKVYSKVYNALNLDPRVREFLKYYRGTKDPEILSMIKHIKNTHSFDMMNCYLSKTYSEMKVDVFTDLASGMKYVIHDEKRLYFPKTMSETDVSDVYRAMLAEQDINSPHRYISSDDVQEIERNRSQGKTVRIFECGAAEGMFSLGLIDYVDEIHIFECEQDWIDALELTFAPYAKKVTIKKAYISDGDDPSNGFLKLDSYIDVQSNNTYDLIKMDIEGAEVKAIMGMMNYMHKVNSFKLFACAYHNENDEKEIRELCQEYEVNANEGYFCFYVDPGYKAPFVRRCVLKITKR